MYNFFKHTIMILYNCFINILWFTIIIIILMVVISFEGSKSFENDETAAIG